MKLVFSRHGESEANVQRVYWNQPGRFPLTPKGRQQAEALADALAEFTFAALYCSPVQRAVETAQIVGRRFGLTPQVADGLREYSVGILEGRTYSQETENLYGQARRQWIEQGNFDARIEADENHPSESYNDIAARFMPMIAGLEARYRDTDATLLLISHGGTLGAMLPLLLANVDLAYPIEHPMGYTNPIVAELREGGWVCLRWGKEWLL
jgi:broad specificity phosphatase PhoE